MLGSLLREQQVQQSNTRDNEQVFFIEETINGENPATSSEIESTQDVKPQNSKMHSR